jgi:CheY-like chemotaxis protein
VEDGSCDLDLPDHQCKLTFKVIDTGCGFGKTDPSKLFHQYFMTHVAAKDGVFGDSSNTSAGKCAAQAGKAVHSESVADSHDRSPVSTFLWTRRTSKVAPSDCDGDSESVATGQRSSDLTLTELDPEVRLRPAVSRPKQLNRSRAYGERTFHSDAPNRQSSTASYCEDEPDGTEADVGVGIGLPMAKQIVDMMGGTISLSRTADNTTVLAFTVSTTAASVSSHGDSKGTAKHRSVARAHRNSASTLTSSSQNESDCELTVEKLSELAQDLQRRDSLNLLPPRKSSAIRWRSVLHAHRVSVLQLARQAPRQDSEAKASVSNDGDGAVDCKSSSPREDSEECGQTIVDSADAAGPATPVPPQVLADKFASGSDANQLVVPLPIKSFAFQVPSSVVAPSHTGLSGMRVLVVDDERAIRRLCQRMLERLGCTCVLLEDGDQVMDTLLASGYVPRNSSEITGHSAAPFQPFHAVLMDIMMVRSNGVDVVIDVLNRFGLADENDEGMHRIECTPPPFIAMTANTSLTDITNYKHAGFVNVLGKPFDAGALKSKLLTFHP